MTPRYLIKAHRPEPLLTVYIVEWQENFGEASGIDAVFLDSDAAYEYADDKNGWSRGGLEYTVSTHHVKDPSS